MVLAPKKIQSVAYKRHFGVSNHSQPEMNKYNTLAIIYSTSTPGVFHVERCGNGLSLVVSTGNARGVFVGYCVVLMS